MYEIVIVLEIHSTHILVMRQGGQVVRILRRDGLHVGQKIFILPEDILTGESPTLIAFPTGPKHDTRHHAWARQLTSVAAALALCVTLLFAPQLAVDVYAVASIDGDASVQMQLDQNERILSICSVDGSIPQSRLNLFRGRSLDQLGPELIALLGNGVYLVGYAPQADQAGAQDLQLDQLFPNQKTILLVGTIQDVDAARQGSVSLGRYMAGLKAADSDWDDLDDLSLCELMSLLEQDPHWMDLEEFREALEEKQEDPGQDDDDDDEDEDDKGSHEDDDDDSQDAPLKDSPIAAPTAPPEQPPKNDSDTDSSSLDSSDEDEDEDDDNKSDDEDEDDDD